MEIVLGSCTMRPGARSHPHGWHRVGIYVIHGRGEAAMHAQVDPKRGHRQGRWFGALAKTKYMTMTTTAHNDSDNYNDNDNDNDNDSDNESNNDSDNIRQQQ